MQSNPKRDKRGRLMRYLVPALRALSLDNVKQRDPSRRPIEAIEIERQLFRATDLAEAPVEASFGDRSTFIHSERLRNTVKVHWGKVSCAPGNVLEEAGLRR